MTLSLRSYIIVIGRRCGGKVVSSPGNGEHRLHAAMALLYPKLNRVVHSGAVCGRQEDVASGSGVEGR